MNKNIDIIDILEDINSLRLFSDTIEMFWIEYLYNISVVSKSDFAIILDMQDKSIYKEYINNQIISEEKKEILLKDIDNLLSRTLTNKYAFEKSTFENKYYVSIKVDNFDNSSDKILLLLVENINKSDFTNIILRTLLCKDIPKSYYNYHLSQTDDKKIVSFENDDSYLMQVLHIINTIINEKKFKLASMKLVNELANRFHCTKVSLGWQKSGFVNTIALSYVETFLDSSYAIKSLEAVFEEAIEQDIEVFYPMDKNSELITKSHEFYLKENILNSIYSFPIRVEDDVIGVVTFEKDDKEFSDIELEVIRLSLNFLTPILQSIYLKDMNIIQKVSFLAQNSLEEFLGVKNTLKKAFIISFTILLLWVVFGKLEYKVESVTSIETDNIEYVCAPFDGVVKSVSVSLGDDVKKGDLLVSFDTKELMLQKVEVSSDIIRYETEAEKARSIRELADMKMALAKKNQATANLEKLDYFLSRANIYTTQNGVVVDGDREKITGSPFGKGDIIMQIANPTDLYAKIKVEEQYIDEIKVGQFAELNLLSRPDEYFKVRIEKIVPMANVDSQKGNVFILKVVFIDKVQDWMRPGMGGIAKVQIEDRTILWILTHKISDFLHMYIWW